MYSKARPALIKSMKTNCSKWVSQYARGGSARSQSARKMYIAVDATVGWLATNGLAPAPPAKAKKITVGLAEARELMSKGL